MKRYTIDNPMDLSIEFDEGEFVFYDEAQAEIDRLKAENAELLMTQYEFADLVESALPIIDRGGWAEISAELRMAIAKARGES